MLADHRWTVLLAAVTLVLLLASAVSSVVLR